MPRTPFSLAASSAPRPHWPATWNTTCEPSAIWLSASSLHLAWSTKSSEYACSVLVAGLVLGVQAGHVADQVAGLVLGKQQALDVLRLRLHRRLRVVDDREVRL